MTTNEVNLDNLLGFVDEGLLQFSEEAHEGINRARLIQGDPQFQKDAELSGTVRYKGGIGLSVNNLPEEIVKEGKIVSLESGDYVTFETLDVVVLASARLRRYFAEIDGNLQLACGTNQDGAHAKGWSGVSCAQCQYHPKNWDGDKKESCKASVTVLIYIPRFDHIAVMDIRGGSYMQGTAWMSNLAEISKRFAERPDVQAKNPDLKRVNTYFFKTTLKASEFKQGKDNNKYQELQFTKASSPYDWPSLLNDGDVIQKAQKALKDMEETWHQFFVAHNPNAALSQPEDAAVASLPAGAKLLSAGSPAPTASPSEESGELQESTIELDEPAAQPSVDAPAQPAEAPAEQPAEAQPAAADESEEVPMF